MTIRALSLKQLILSTTVVSILFISGCANTGSSLFNENNSGSQTADPRLTQGNDAEFFSKSGLQACAAGAAIGVMSCMLSGTSNHAQCAVIAGVSACGVAMGANYYLDQRRSEYASSAERLEAMSQDIKEDTQKVIARTQTARRVMAEDRQRIERIEQEIAEQRANQASVQRELAGIDSNIGILRRDLSNMQKSITEYKEVAQLERQEASPAEVQKVEQEIEVMNQQVIALQQEVDDLYSMRSAITIG